MTRIAPPVPVLVIVVDRDGPIDPAAWGASAEANVRLALIAGVTQYVGHALANDPGGRVVVVTALTESR
jgi:hypothetical protein